MSGKKWKEDRVKPIKTCYWCGKEFEAESGHTRFCSPECSAHYRRAYNAAYRKAQRAQMTDEQRAQENEKSRANWAKKTWDKWKTEANKIIDLTKQDNPTEVVAKYLSSHMRFLAKNQTPPDLSSAIKTEKSLEN